MTTTAIQFTDNAAAKVYQLIQEEGDPSLKLRVFINGGGCSGYQYGFTFDNKINSDDTIVEKTVKNTALNAGAEDAGDAGGDAGSASAAGTVQLLVDPMSFQLLIGAEIDYREDANGAQFVIRNPNAKTTCGCGSSFSA